MPARNMGPDLRLWQCLWPSGIGGGRRFASPRFPGTEIIVRRFLVAALRPWRISRVEFTNWMQKLTKLFGTSLVILRESLASGRTGTYSPNRWRSERTFQLTSRHWISSACLKVNVHADRGERTTSLSSPSARLARPPRNFFTLPLAFIFAPKLRVEVTMA